MSQKKGLTQDERFMVGLYEFALRAGDVYSSQNRYDVGKAVSLNPKAVNAICKLLVQANFIKKSSEEEVYLTTHGEKLAERLMEDV